WGQWMQKKVQKSNRTTLPRRSARVSSLPPEFIHRRPISSGARTLTTCVEDFVCVAVALVPAAAAVGVDSSGLLAMPPWSQFLGRAGLPGVFVCPARAREARSGRVGARPGPGGTGPRPDGLRLAVAPNH